MNIFGAFTFGSLIKTFLPGFVWLFAFTILAADGAQLLHFRTDIWAFLKSNEQTALVLAIPLSILLGLMSNIIVFMGVNDRLVRNPMRTANPVLFAMCDGLEYRIREQCWTALAPQNDINKPFFFKNLDVELVILEKIGVEKLAYVREQYWYHLEFQLNLMLSLIAIFVALAVASILNKGWFTASGLVVMWIAIGIFVSRWLLVAARKNYLRHVAKMASLMTAVLCSTPAEAKDQ
jgi:hypothetical protein